MARHFPLLALLTSIVAGCSGDTQRIEELGIPPAIDESTVQLSFSTDVKPILDARCVGCHSCYDAPCQLNLTAYEGIVRGASKARVYEPTRLTEAPLSRLFFDAETTQAWRAKGFHPVLSSSTSRNEGSRDFSVLAGFVNLKTANPLTPDSLLDDNLPLDDSDAWQCPIDAPEFVDFARAHPLRGMPYALPGLSPEELGTLNRWIAQGAPDDTDFSISEAETRAIETWENFFNGDSLKNRLYARYIYEHLFLGSLYFEDQPNGRFFQLVRSRTPPGTPIDLIATRRPYNDPGVDRVYYRLRLQKGTVVAKTHMPYRLDGARMQSWSEWFSAPEYTVTALPGYAIESASNPFVTFAQLPAQSRYRFMLSEASFTVRGFIKGPVCHGQSAVNVINEHFWVFFMDPALQTGEAMETYLAAVSDELDLPAEREDSLRLFDAWDDFAEKEKAFLDQRRAFYSDYASSRGAFQIDMVWDGDDQNPNAALTVFRHFDHASVRQGLIGQPPKTAWVIDYPLLERIHYLLVAGFDVYGNISHQLLSRIYMDFLRMEGESTFLLLLPSSSRGETREYWYRDAESRIEEFLTLMEIDDVESGIVAPGTPQPQLAVYEALERHIGEAMHPVFRLPAADEASASPVLETIRELQSGTSESFSLLPNSIFLEVTGAQPASYFTLMKHVGHSNNTSVLLETLNIEPAETSVSVVPGFVGPRPNAFMQVSVDEFPAFGAGLRSLSTESDYAALVSSYGVRRSDPDFWSHYDRFSSAFEDFSAVDYGVLDLSKLENR